MTERPILFSGAMVRAILAGRKTVTRREVVSRSHKRPYMVMMNDHPDFPGRQQPFEADEHGSIAFEEKGVCEFPIVCPYGQVGDRLWVRESFADLRGTGIEHRPDPEGPLQRYAFAADSPHGSASDEARKGFGVNWKPSIHMPRAACRLLLEVTGVRVERLQEISVQQVRREGCEVREFWLFGADAEQRQKIAARVFGDLWRDINGRESWDANPWVWVVEFRRLHLTDA